MSNELSIDRKGKARKLNMVGRWENYSYKMKVVLT